MASNRLFIIYNEVLFILLMNYSTSYYTKYQFKSLLIVHITYLGLLVLLSVLLDSKCDVVFAGKCFTERDS